MSYDIKLLDPVSRKTIMLPIKHVMIGGTYRADYDERTGTFSPSPIQDAWLNITYNYSRYYDEATDGDSRFANKPYYANSEKDVDQDEYGICGIYGKSGAESIPMLKDMISRIESRYKVNGKWISTERTIRKYLDLETGKELDILDILTNKRAVDTYKCEEHTVTVWEGPNDNYWEATAANAISPLWKLIAMAELRPDGIWEGD
ncbi:MAG: hypothetical protein IJ091_10365 [Oscillospiraceae bacterium]|nr:hypothetical protein [Oscillospiraceae bacterium]